jgi:hypothetical protein
MRRATVARLAVVTALLGGLLALGGSGPAAATFAGRNGRIAYSVGALLPNEEPAHSQVFTINPDGSGQRRLTNLREPEQAFFGAYSPNARRVAVYAELGPAPDALPSGVYTMDAGGGPLVPVFTLEEPDVILFDWGPAR